MKVRGTIVGTPLSAKLTALCWGALTLLVPVAVSACTSSSSPTTPSIVSPTVTGTESGTVPSAETTSSSGSSSESGTPGVNSTSPAATTTVTPQVTVTQTITIAPSSIPPAAPVTGGGGTAGFQDALLLTLGAVAILAGAGGLIYRRWLGRGH
jgi:hypothetical protein